jgi:hypothetical protein
VGGASHENWTLQTVVQVSDLGGVESARQKFGRHFEVKLRVSGGVHIALIWALNLLSSCRVVDFLEQVEAENVLVFEGNRHLNVLRAILLDGHLVKKIFHDIQFKNHRFWPPLG